MSFDYSPLLVYRVGIGHNVAYLDMEILVQQPQVDPVTPVERHFGVSGAHYDDGLFVRFHFDVIESPELYRSILTQFNLDDVTYGPVTIFAKNERLYVRKYNGTAHLPEIGADTKWTRFFLQDVNIYITDLVEIAE